MNLSKARFRAIRDRVGLSQKALANLLGNTVDVVKKWENPRYPPPPQDACELLFDMLEQHEDAVDTALDIIERQIEAHDGNMPKEVSLLYYRSQAHYDLYGRDAADYSVVNARAREVGALLQAEGFDVAYVYPDDNETMFQALANTRS